MNSLRDMCDNICHRVICVMNPRKTTNRKKGIKIFEEIAKNFPNFMKNINLQVQGTQ